MATKRKKPEDSGFVERLTRRGEEAVSRLLDELSQNPRVTEALGKAMSAKGRVEAGGRRTLSQVGLAAADELKDLRKQIERLERRLTRLESSSGTASKPTAKKAETKKKPTAKKGSTKSKSTAKKATSPAPGRSVGGGTGRSSSPGGGSAAA
jgi:hypothetical protein